MTNLSVSIISPDQAMALDVQGLIKQFSGKAAEPVQNRGGWLVEGHLPQKSISDFQAAAKDKFGGVPEVTVELPPSTFELHG